MYVKQIYEIKEKDKLNTQYDYCYIINACSFIGDNLYSLHVNTDKQLDKALHENKQYLLPIVTSGTNCELKSNTDVFIDFSLDFLNVLNEYNKMFALSLYLDLKLIFEVDKTDIVNNVIKSKTQLGYLVKGIKNGFYLNEELFYFLKNEVLSTDYINVQELKYIFLKLSRIKWSIQDIATYCYSQLICNEKENTIFEARIMNFIDRISTL